MLSFYKKNLNLFVKKVIGSVDLKIMECYLTLHTQKSMKIHIKYTSVKVKSTLSIKKKRKF